MYFNLLMVLVCVSVKYVSETLVQHKYISPKHFLCLFKNTKKSAQSRKPFLLLTFSLQFISAIFAQNHMSGSHSMHFTLTVNNQQRAPLCC